MMTNQDAPGFDDGPLFKISIIKILVAVQIYRIMGDMYGRSMF